MMRGCYRGCPKVKKSPIFDSHLRCSAPTSPHAVYEMVLGGSLERSRSQLCLVCRVCWHSSNNQCTIAGKRSKCRPEKTFRARKTVENRQKSHVRLWFTGYWTSADKPDITDAAVTAIFPVIPIAPTHIPFVCGVGRAPFFEFFYIFSIEFDFHQR